MSIADMPVLEIILPIRLWFRFDAFLANSEAFAEIMNPVMGELEDPEKATAQGGGIWWNRYIYRAALDSVVVTAQYDDPADEVKVIFNMRSVSLLIFTAESMLHNKDFFRQYGLLLQRRFVEINEENQGNTPSVDQIKQFLDNAMVTEAHINALVSRIKAAGNSTTLFECAKSEAFKAFKL